MKNKYGDQLELKFDLAEAENLLNHELEARDKAITGASPILTSVPA